MIRPEALSALRDYEQTDEEGIMVLVSRQAIDEAIEVLASPSESPAIEIGRLANRILKLAPSAGLYIGIKIMPASGADR